MSGSDARASNASCQSVINRMTVTALIIARFERVIGNHHDEHLDLVEVARGAAHQLTGLGSVVVADVQRHDVAEESLAESGLGPPGFAERIEATERREEPCEQPGERDEAGPQPQHLIVTNAAVDAEPDENG